jgi:hypothetical protein
MRLTSLVPTAFILFMSGPAFAQEWIEYISQADAFSINFPAEPEVTEVRFPSEYGVDLPARVYSHTGRAGKYTVTVVDYSNARKLHAERLDGCKAYPNTCANPWANELRGAIDFGLWDLLQRDAKLTHYAYYNSDRVEGRRLQLLNSDKTRTFAAIHLHKNKLYIFEGTVPPGAAPPGLFQQSVGWVDPEGNRVRYEEIYSNHYPEPPLQKELSILEGRER